MCFLTMGLQRAMQKAEGDKSVLDIDVFIHAWTYFVILL